MSTLNALENIYGNDNLIKTIISKRFNWANKSRQNEAKQEANKNKKHDIYRWKRTSKESFGRIKEQLKRPMH